MKKLAALLLLLGALLALAACGYPVKPENSGTPDAAVTTVKPDSGYTLGGADVVQLNGFRSIDIEWISGSVSVELYDGEGIEIKETLADDGAVSVPMEWRVNEDDSTLDIRSQPQLPLMEVTSSSSSVRVSSSVRSTDTAALTVSISNS